MKLLKSFTLLATLVLLTFSSCDLPEHYFEPKPECHNSLDFFDTNAADAQSTAYQTKAINLLRDKKPHQFRYFFKTFLEEKRNTYMLTNFRNEVHCFDVKILVEDWTKLAGMRRTNGKSYPKELYNLKWEITNINGKQEVLYIDMHDIID